MKSSLHQVGTDSFIKRRPTKPPDTDTGSCDMSDDLEINQSESTLKSEVSVSVCCPSSSIDAPII